MPPAFQSGGVGSLASPASLQPQTEPKASGQSRRTQVISYDIERRTCFHRPFIHLHFTAEIIHCADWRGDRHRRTNGDCLGA